MARKSLSQILADAAVAFPDNTTGLITPLGLRTWIGDLVNAIRPAYGLIRLASAVQAVTATPAPIVMATGQLSPVIDYVLTPVSGQIVRSDPGMCRFTFTTDISGANNQNVTFSLFQDGVTTDWRQSIRLSGTGITESVSFPMIKYSNALSRYQIMIEATPSGNVTLTDCAIIAETVPVWEFT